MVESPRWLQPARALRRQVGAAVESNQKNIMANDNQVSAVITDQNVADILGHITAIQGLLPFLLSRANGDSIVMLGEKSVGFDEKCAGYMASNPEFIPGYVDPAEVIKDRALRAQFVKFLPPLQLLAAKVVATYDVVGNEMMMADLAYYSSTGDAAKRGRPSAGDIRDDLATRYPGRTGAKTTQTTAQTAVS
jgi:hypothetical protein